MIAAIIVFGVSLSAIAILFLIKHVEERNAYVIAPSIRAAADRSALRFKALLSVAEAKLEQMPPTTARMLRRILVLTAQSFGSALHRFGQQSHKLADLVSHKHNFERRETRSEFLKSVSEHKNNLPTRGNGQIVHSEIDTNL